MDTTSTVKRQYRSPLRVAQAAATRGAVLTAAAHLFVERGFVATSIDAVAEAAGVSRATVFTAVGGKPALLKAAYDVALVGDDEPVSLAARERSNDIRAEPDARRYLERYAELVSEMNARLAPIYEVIRGAASADPEARSVWERTQAERAIGATHVVGDVVSKGRLKHGLTPRTAADVVFAMVDPGLYHVFVHGRGWSREQFASWLGETLRAQLLASQQ